MAHIIIPKCELKVSGDVVIDILDYNGNTKQHQEFTNNIHDDLLDDIATAMQSGSAVNSFINTGSDWFDSTYPSDEGASVNEDGILISQSGLTADGITAAGPGNENTTKRWDLFLDENLSTTYSTNTCAWQAEGTWTGTRGSGTATSGSFDIANIGENYIDSEQYNLGAGGMRLLDRFGVMFASATSDAGDFTAFSLDDNDVARFTWTITINV